MPPAKPSLDLLRSLTDEHVLRALMDHRRLTRAEIAAITGISKPTVSESMRRLAQANAVRQTGEHTTGRGRAGSYYALEPGLGAALVVGIAPQGVRAECVDLHGDQLGEAVVRVPHTARPGLIRKALRTVVTHVGTAIEVPIRVATVSAADPVERTTGKLLHLPDAPFLLGELDPVRELTAFVSGHVTVDNDVNWAARAEQAAGQTDRPLTDFAYLYLGDGLGCAVVNDGVVRRGHGGVAGEVSHVLTSGANGSTTTFTDVFAELGLRRDGTTAINSGVLLTSLEAATTESDRLLGQLAESVSGVLAAIVALVDPELIVMGGTWGSHSRMVDLTTRAFSAHRRSVPLRRPKVTTDPAHLGARRQACEDLRLDVLRRPLPADGVRPQAHA